MTDVRHAGEEEDADVENRASDADNEDKDEIKEEGKYCICSPTRYTVFLYD
jgi:hypothetical protein